MNFKRIWAIARKEFIHIRRDPRTIALILLMPVMQMFLFGYAVSTNVEHIKTVIWDQAKDQRSREFVQALVQSHYFDVVAYVENHDAIREWVDKGKARVGFVIPADFSRRMDRGEAAPVQVLVDGSDPMTASTVLSTAGAIAQAKSSEWMVHTLRQRGIESSRAPLARIDLRPWVWYNPEMKSVNFNIPGLIGVILQNITMMLTAFAIVREREKGTLEQLIVTPIKPVELMWGKVIPYIIIGFADLLLAIAVGILWFRVPVHGNLLLLLALSFVFLVGALGIGLLISTVSRTQLQAMQLTMFLVMPNILLSGFMFPQDAMPKVVQKLGEIIPLTYFIQILRAIILKGVGLSYLWFQVIYLLVFGVVIIIISALKFRKNLE
ncbi:ABC transporter permease [Thermanaeromonas sp. C210]|uniref:ABC transporter permease n=1 Tax=Thermanaeromonas sp. C210 TaxID=2731925 RepID=UPI00155BEF91|nr:ABC transporter permease [Thermanaeromonas sp. C210]GFN21834.1 transport permease protein [Thermanaeromonas sp. C210]